MDYLKQIYNRTDLQQIVGFILYGTEKTNPEPIRYNEIIDDAYRNFSKLLEDQPIERKYKMNIEEACFSLLSDTEEIHTVIGMKIIAKLLYQLLNDEYL